MSQATKNEIYNILVYDDAHSDCSFLTELLYEICGKENICVKVAENFEELSELISGKFALAFLDIRLDRDINGIQVAETLRSLSKDTKIIFVTAYIQYCEEVFHADPSGFIVKPITYEKVKKALSFLQYHFEQRKTISFRQGMEVVHLSPTEISYVEITGRAFAIYDRHFRLLRTVKQIKLSDFCEMLPENFLRCHYSYVVNMRCVEQIRHFCFLLKNGKKIPVPQKKYAAVKEQYLRFLEEDLL